ncbi:MAG: 3-phosphoglycerate kinase [Pseudomonas sp.]|uniref:3-phosphoglycerate kinase n=1 Tax=Pseudomonas sp. TaxID=306 RepID=UPI003393A0B5
MNKNNLTRHLTCALLLLVPFEGFAAYPIEVEKQLNGAEISYATQDIDNDLGGLTLTNLGQAAASCSAVFRNGPEAPRTRKVILDAGQTNNLSVKFNRNIIKLRITLTCAPHTPQ